MPTMKHVRFLDPLTTKVLYQTPFTPSSTVVAPPKPSTCSGLSSPASSDSPRYNTFPLCPARIIRSVIRVHPALANGTALYFDVVRPLLTSSPSLSSRAILLPPAKYVYPLPDGALLDEPATCPPLPSITLISDLLPWLTRVEASQLSFALAVTVGDVLQTLLNNLSTPITSCEWSCLPPATQELITAAFYQRMESIPDRSLRESQRRKGVRRIDFLTGRTRFTGLSPVADKHGVFVVGWSFA